MISFYFKKIKISKKQLSTPERKEKLGASEAERTNKESIKIVIDWVSRMQPTWSQSWRQFVQSMLKEGGSLCLTLREPTASSCRRERPTGPVHLESRLLVDEFKILAHASFSSFYFLLYLVLLFIIQKHSSRSTFEKLVERVFGKC